MALYLLQSVQYIQYPKVIILNNVSTSLWCCESTWFLIAKHCVCSLILLVWIFLLGMRIKLSDTILLRSASTLYCWKRTLQPEWKRLPMSGNCVFPKCICSGICNEMLSFRGSMLCILKVIFRCMIYLRLSMEELMPS